ncbi:hypothetical protein N9N06_01060 [Aquiluna sp.]|nr:hypothetical protein [Aquiluna sp.]
MPLSPLDKTISSSQNSRGRKSRWVSLAVFSVAGLASIGSVFAASVTLNGEGNVSFAQGVETIAACDTAIDASLGAAFDTSGQAFVLDAITLTGVASSCDGEALTITIYDGTTVQLTVTGTIDLSGGSIASIAASGSLDIVADDGSSDPLNTYTGIGGTEVVSYQNDQTSALVASGADRITIEIN